MSGKTKTSSLRCGSCGQDFLPNKIPLTKTDPQFPNLPSKQIKPNITRRRLVTGRAQA